MKNSGSVFHSLRRVLTAAYETISGPVQITISHRNDKMGAIPSVSLAPVFTCANCEHCRHNCYGLHGRYSYPSNQKSVSKNTVMARRFPDSYWAQVNAAVTFLRFFRFHVVGDIPGASYFTEMVNCAAKNPHCEMLAFTKRYDVVNDYIDEHGDLPKNLHIIFSRWPGTECDNRHNLPESHVIFKGTTEIPENWMVCPGKCEDCAARGCGCWTMGKGEHISFKEH